MKVSFLPLEGAKGVANRLVKRARQDRVGRHEYTKKINSSDIKIVVESKPDHCGKNVLSKNFHKKDHEYYIYSVSDRPSRVLPGVYVSMPKRYFDKNVHKSYSYSKLKNKKLEKYKGVSKNIRVSFMGSMRNKLRYKIKKLEISSSYIEDTSDINFFNMNKTNTKYDDVVSEKEEKYSKIMNSSKFVLCPRGFGTSSFRLFEAMYCGCVPIIISDSWVPPEGPNWKKFSIRVDESDIFEIPHIINKYEKSFEKMSKKSREEWERHFSPSVMFDKIVQKCAMVRKKYEICKPKDAILRNLYKAEYSMRRIYTRYAKKIKRRL